MGRLKPAFSRQNQVSLYPMDLAEVVTDSLKLVRSTTPANIEIQEEIAPDCFAIVGDKTQMNQILINLCNNAVDALPVTGGRITILLGNTDVDNQAPGATSGLKPGWYVELKVVDNGHGMDQGTLKRIFESYFTTKPFGKGSGIGLAVVHGIVKNHHGTIACSSTKGAGTTFTILLPAHQEPVAGNEQDQTLTPGKGEKILCVDDEPSIAKLTRLHLNALGYEAVSTTDPEEALAWIKSDPDKFDLVISDMAMPKLPGDRLIAQILEIRPDMPAIICSGYSARVSEADASALGVAAFVMKPMDKAALASTIRKVLDRQRSA